MNNKKINVLIIEDDPELLMALSLYLKKYGMDTTCVEEPYIGLSILTQKDFDIVILDLTLPGMDGLDVIKKIREHSNIPIIISSARNDLTDKVIGLERGADDYMPKPYDPRELVTRIKAVLRRSQANEQKPQKGSFEIDGVGKCTVILGNLLPDSIYIIAMKKIITDAKTDSYGYLKIDVPDNPIMKHGFRVRFKYKDNQNL